MDNADLAKVFLALAGAIALLAKLAHHLVTKRRDSDPPPKLAAPRPTLPSANQLPAFAYADSDPDETGPHAPFARAVSRNEHESLKQEVHSLRTRLGAVENDLRTALAMVHAIDQLRGTLERVNDEVTALGKGLARVEGRLDGGR